MAAKQPSVSFYGAGGDGSIMVAVWVLDTTDDRGVGINVPEWIDQTWFAQVDGGGSLGGGTVAVETAPSNTDAIYAPCSNAAGGAVISLGTLSAGAAGKVATSIECAGFMRPKLNGSAGATGVRVTLTARRANPMRT